MKNIHNDNIKFKIQKILLLVIIFFVFLGSGLKILSNPNSHFLSKGRNDGFAVTGISSGTYDSAAIISENGIDDLYVWGNNSMGQLGLGNKEDKYIPTKATVGPYALSENEKIKEVEFGDGDIAVVVNDGNKDDLWMSGANNFGQLGLGTQDDSNVFKKVTTGDKELKDGDIIQKVCLSQSHSFAMIKTNSTSVQHLYSWGVNNVNTGLGKSEIGGIIKSPEEITVGSLSLKKDVVIKGFSSEEHHSIAIVENYNGEDFYYVWGKNHKGDFGYKEAPEKTDVPIKGTLPFEYKNLEGVNVGSGTSFILATDNKGIQHILSTGENISGSLGLGEEDWYTTNEFKDITSGSYVLTEDQKVKSFSSRDLTSLVIIEDSKSSDELFSWGDNSYGQLGLGDNEDKNEPTKIETNGYELDEIKSGGEHTIGLTSSPQNNNSIFLTGMNSHGQLGIGDKTSSNIFVKPKFNTSLKLSNAISNSSKTYETEISVDVDETLSSSFNDDLDYSLEMIDTDDNVVGTSDGNHLSTLGTQTFNVTDLSDATPYIDMRIRITNFPDKFSDTFSFTTKDKYPFWLENATLVSVDYNSANISVDVKQNNIFNQSYSFNDDEPYSLKVVDLSGQTIGVSDAIDWSTIGIKTFTITSLESDHSYGNVKVVIVDQEQIASNEFELTTTKKNIIKLTSPNVESIDTTSAKISVNAEVPIDVNTNDEPVIKYSLEVIDDTNETIGNSDGVNYETSGLKNFNLTGLISDHDYGKVKVRVVNTEIVSDDIFLKTNKKNISSLTLATIESVGSTSAKLSVSANVLPDLDINDVNVEFYSLEVIDASKHTIGSSSAQNLSKSGEQLFNLTGLETAKNYGNVKVRVVGTEITSNKFKLETSIGDIDSLTNAVVQSETRNSVDISVDANLDSYLENTVVNTYSLIIVDSISGNKIGDGGLIDETETGLKQFTIKGLQVETEYSVQVQVESDPTVKSNIISFTTKKQGVETLSKPSVSEITNMSATITVTVNPTSSLSLNDIEEYTLIVSDENGNEWYSNPLKESGEQKVEVDNLTAGKLYNMNIMVMNQPDTKIKIPIFETMQTPFIPKSNSFVIHDGSIRKNTFTFDIEVNVEDYWKGDPFNPNDLQLYANNKELEIEFKSSKEDVYTYDVVNLIPHSTYNDFESSIKHSDKRIGMTDSLGISIIVKTKININIVYLSVIALIIALTFIAFVIMIIFRWKKSKAEDRMISQIKFF